MSVGGEKVLDRVLTFVLRFWSFTSLAMLMFAGMMWAIGGKGLLVRFCQQGPYSIFPLTMAAVGLIWLTIGVAVILLRFPLLRQNHGEVIIVTLAILLLYTNILRERITYGDFWDYVKAAQNLYYGETLHQRYLYPPLLATVLVPLVPLGSKVIAGILWLANILALGLYIVLGIMLLRRYGFSRHFAAIAVFTFCLVNVPILRTLGYVQVNLHLANLLLISLWAYPKYRPISAIALGLSAHLKGSPLLLALAFLLARDWRWLGWFAVSLCVLALVTLMPFGTQPFADFVRNALTIYQANGINFRENSIDSLVRSTAFVFGMDPDTVNAMPTFLKVLIFLFAAIVLKKTLQNRPYSFEANPSGVVLNSAPVLILILFLSSPLIWEHHPVFVGLPYLLLLRQLSSATEFSAYAIAFFLQFHVPTFDLYPWSFNRLMSTLLVLWLCYHTAKHSQNGVLSRILNEGQISLSMQTDPTVAPTHTRDVAEEEG